MKKIFKLRGEILIYLVISIITGLIIAFTITSVYRNMLLNDKKIESMAIEINNKHIEHFKRETNIDSKDEYTIHKNILNIVNSPNKYNSKIFIVDKQGFVKNSIGILGIKQIDIRDDQINKIDINNNFFTSTNVFKINNNTNVVYISEGYIYDDKITMEAWFIISLIIFFILISGRVQYISTISKGVDIVAKGDLSNRINIKYNNELTELANGINYMTKELQRQEINQQEFLTNISHDLRTPLTTIIGYSRMIEEKVYSNEEELQRYVSVISKKSNYLKSMLDTFFEFTKLASGDVELNKHIINLNEMIMQLLDGEEPAFEERGLKINLNLGSEAIYTNADPTLIARGFSNLINNSLKYSKEGSYVDISISKRCINNVNYAILSIGNIPKFPIDKIDIDNMFKRLYKIDKSRPEQGSGLGLSIVQSIVKIHNGFIKVCSIGEKLEFYIGLIQVDNI